jgi:hypothetical protein
MLIRYKKAGGFLQLVKLLEGFGAEKRDKFLDLVEKEDAFWARALKGKLLSVEKIFSWDPQVISDITARMHDKNIAAMIHGLDEVNREKIYSLLGHSERRRIDSAVAEIKPNVGEISSAFGKLIEETRNLITTGGLRLDKIDPDLMIEENIEEHLASGAHFSSSPYHSSKKDEAPGGLDFSMADHLGGGTKESGAVDAKEYDLLKRKVINLTKEINLLKKDNQVMAEKLAQIKKIA